MYQSSTVNCRRMRIRQRLNLIGDWVTVSFRDPLALPLIFIPQRKNGNHIWTQNFFTFKNKFYI